MFGIENSSWIFIILGIVVAFNSGKIDEEKVTLIILDALFIYT